ncbi:hypothetical protein BpHYR1_051163 [Brachionus plicatilis]|uniref:Uncharacterized protein n=1 Tax=Brachionus plicatilis TaxID=10195 RepID=A0A3M7PTC0_BRAPC|nr:hypothetical protein BpHYR1_051163 [Brachionus plicatilis]
MNFSRPLLSQKIGQIQFEVKVSSGLGKRRFQVVPHLKVGIDPGLASARVWLRLHRENHVIMSLIAFVECVYVFP